MDLLGVEIEGLRREVGTKAKSKDISALLAQQAATDAGQEAMLAKLQSNLASETERLHTELRQVTQPVSEQIDLVNDRIDDLLQNELLSALLDPANRAFQPSSLDARMRSLEAALERVRALETAAPTTRTGEQNPQDVSQLHDQIRGRFSQHQKQLNYLRENVFEDDGVDEKRYAEVDGIAYTYSEFVEMFGDDAANLWAQSRPQTSRGRVTKKPHEQITELRGFVSQLQKDNVEAIQARAETDRSLAEIQASILGFAAAAKCMEEQGLMPKGNGDVSSKAELERIQKDQKDQAAAAAVAASQLNSLRGLVAQGDKALAELREQLASTENNLTDLQRVKRDLEAEGLTGPNVPTPGTGPSSLPLRQQLELLRSNLGDIQAQQAIQAMRGGRSFTPEVPKAPFPNLMDVEGSAELMANFANAVRFLQKDSEMNSGKVRDLSEHGVKMDAALLQLLHMLDLLTKQLGSQGAGSDVLNGLGSVKNLLGMPPPGGGQEPFVSQASLDMAIDKSQADTQVRFLKLQEDVNNALGDKADAAHLRLLSMEMEEAVRRPRSVPCTPRNDRDGFAAISRVPVGPARCIVCDSKVGAPMLPGPDTVRRPWRENEVGGPGGWRKLVHSPTEPVIHAKVELPPISADFRR